MLVLSLGEKQLFQAASNRNVMLITVIFLKKKITFSSRKMAKQTASDSAEQVGVKIGFRFIANISVILNRVFLLLSLIPNFIYSVGNSTCIKSDKHHFELSPSSSVSPLPHYRCLIVSSPKQDNNQGI